MKKSQKKPYSAPQVTTYSSSEILQLVGPAIAVYGPMGP